MKRNTIVLLGVAVFLVIAGLSCVSAYNKLVALDQGVSAQWAQVENVYQRRADLVPNLVETVKGAANFLHVFMMAPNVVILVGVKNMVTIFAR